MTVAIGGAGHSGSTLLGLVLGSHRRAFYAGEAKKSLFLGDATRPLRKRRCKLCPGTCPVWSRVGPPPHGDLYETLCRLTDADVLVDSTKAPAWIAERAAQSKAAGAKAYFIWLTRDGRAVVNSRLRKAPGADPEALIRAWMQRVEESRALEAAFGPDRGVRVRYEELVTDPEAEVRRLCRFLDLPFEKAMLRYEMHEHHPLGGNTGTQSIVARARTGDATTRSDFPGSEQSPLARVPARSRHYYDDLRQGFRLDLRYRDELPTHIARLFGRLAGAHNEPFRWE